VSTLASEREHRFPAVVEKVAIYSGDGNLGFRRSNSSLVVGEIDGEQNNVGEKDDEQNKKSAIFFLLLANCTTGY
jgi:hypothetical protein